MDNYLFLITVGPVQDFIAAARRSRDLWAGSQLLSELSREAARALRKDHGGELIFPAQEDLEEGLEKHEVVNRILASVTTEDVKALGAAIERAIREKLDEHCQQTFNQRIQWPACPTKNMRDQAEAQVADLIEVYWAAVEATSNYQADRERLEAALAARKNTRDFIQPSWAAPVPKSSIDGARESVIHEDEYAPPQASAEQRREVAERLFRKFGAKGGERLSGVDLLKRHFRLHDSHADFPSTSHFAALPLLDRHRQSLTCGLQAYLDKLKDSYDDQEGNRRLGSLRLAERFAHLNLLNNYDASILFTSRLDEDLADAPLWQARSELARYRKAALAGAEPDPYYALLHADGDFMGKTIDALARPRPGEQARDAQGRHRSFSLKLDAFATAVRNIVERDHMGALVYSGGDDVLAFLPLHTVLACARQLAEAFRTRLGEFGYDDEGLKRRVSPTLSVGIAICHHLEPLSDALELARGAEKLAKKVPGKNALAVTLSKRGSGDRSVSGSWEPAQGPGQPLAERLARLAEWHQQGAIPDSAAFDLHSLVERLGDTLPPAALRAEAVRIVKRKRGLRGQAQEANNELVKLAEALPADAEAAKQWSLAQFANELIIAREFAQAAGYEDKQQGANQ